MKAVLRVLCVSLVSVPPLMAATNYVWQGGSHTAPFDTWERASTNIQIAVNAAVGPTNVVLVTNGWYGIGAQIDIDRPVTVRSVNGAADTVVYRTGAADHRIFQLHTAGSVLDGFTVSNGLANVAPAPGNAGGGILIDTNGVVQNCVITHNSASDGTRGGSGVCFTYDGILRNSTITRNSGSQSVAFDPFGGADKYGVPVVENCVISYNNGGGVYMRAYGVLRGCAIFRNWRNQSSGAMMLDASAYVPLTVESCTIAHNTSVGYYGTIYQWTTDSTYRSNNIIYGNTSFAIINDVMQRTVPGAKGPNLSGRNFRARYSLLPYAEHYFGVQEGNLARHDPMFVDPDNDDFRLAPGSPCIDAGSNWTWMASAKDLAGNDRVSGAVVDMGAYEYTPGALDAWLAATNARGNQPFAGQAVHFKGYAAGTNLAGLYYQWDFNNNGTFETSGPAADAVTNIYAAGAYTVKLRVTNTVGEAAERVRTAYIKAGPENLYVAQGGAHTYPYDSWPKAATNIQAAVDAGVDGSTVWVADGTYLLDSPIGIHDNGVILRSVNGHRHTFLDGQDSVICLEISHYAAVVDGFTIQNGRGGSAGGLVISAFDPGVVKLADGVIVRNCHIRNNYGSYGGVHIASVGVLRNCLVEGNTGTSRAAGVYAGHYAALQNVTVTRNSATSSSTDSASGIWGAGWTVIDEHRNVINYGNVSTHGLDQWKYGASHSFIEHSLSGTDNAWYTRGVGNISNLPPQFVEAGAGNFRIASSSPAVDAGTNMPWHAEIGATDLDGAPRLIRGIVDMGAYEAGPRGAVLFLR